MAEVTNDLKSILNVDSLTDEELIRAIRVSIKAEIDAVHLYQMIADATSNPKAKVVMEHTAKEERVHIGEFMRLIQELSPSEMDDYNEGARETEDVMAQLNGQYESKRTKGKSLSEWNNNLGSKLSESK